MAVYFITCRKSGTVKIGCAYNPFSRLKELQVGTAFKLKVEAVIAGSYKRERELHTLLKNHRLKGEWFKLCPAIEAIIKEAGNPTRLKSLAEKRRANWDELNVEAIRRPTPPPMRIPSGFTFETLPAPRVTAAFDERQLSKAHRRRIATGDITFPFRVREPA